MKMHSENAIAVVHNYRRSITSDIRVFLLHRVRPCLHLHLPERSVLCCRAMPRTSSSGSSAKKRKKKKTSEQPEPEGSTTSHRTGVDSSSTKKTEKSSRPKLDKLKIPNPAPDPDVYETESDEEESEVKDPKPPTPPSPQYPPPPPVPTGEAAAVPSTPPKDKDPKVQEEQEDPDFQTPKVTGSEAVAAVVTLGPEEEQQHSIVEGEAMDTAPSQEAASPPGLGHPAAGLARQNTVNLENPPGPAYNEDKRSLVISDEALEGEESTVPVDKELYLQVAEQSDQMEVDPNSQQNGGEETTNQPSNPAEGAESSDAGGGAPAGGGGGGGPSGGGGGGGGPPGDNGDGSEDKKEGESPSDDEDDMHSAQSSFHEGSLAPDWRPWTIWQQNYQMEEELDKETESEMDAEPPPWVAERLYTWGFVQGDEGTPEELSWQKIVEAMDQPWDSDTVVPGNVNTYPRQEQPSHVVEYEMVKSQQDADPVAEEHFQELQRRSVRDNGYMIQLCLQIRGKVHCNRIFLRPGASAGWLAPLTIPEIQWCFAEAKRLDLCTAGKKEFVRMHLVERMQSLIQAIYKLFANVGFDYMNWRFLTMIHVICMVLSNLVGRCSACMPYTLQKDCTQFGKQVADTRREAKTKGYHSKWKLFALNNTIDLFPSYPALSTLTMDTQDYVRPHDLDDQRAILDHLIDIDVTEWIQLTPEHAMNGLRNETGARLYALYYNYVPPYEALPRTLDSLKGKSDEEKNAIRRERQKDTGALNEYGRHTIAFFAAPELLIQGIKPDTWDGTPVLSNRRAIVVLPALRPGEQPLTVPEAWEKEEHYLRAFEFEGEGNVTANYQDCSLVVSLKTKREPHGKPKTLDSKHFYVPEPDTPDHTLYETDHQAPLDPLWPNGLYDEARKGGAVFTPTHEPKVPALYLGSVSPKHGGSLPQVQIEIEKESLRYVMIAKTDDSRLLTLIRPIEELMGLECTPIEEVDQDCVQGKEEYYRIHSHQIGSWKYAHPDIQNLDQFQESFVQEVYQAILFVHDRCKVSEDFRKLRLDRLQRPTGQAITNWEVPEDIARGCLTRFPDFIPTMRTTAHRMNPEWPWGRLYDPRIPESLEERRADNPNCSPWMDKYVTPGYEQAIEDNIYQNSLAAELTSARAFAEANDIPLEDNQTRLDNMGSRAASEEDADDSEPEKSKKKVASTVKRKDDPRWDGTAIQPLTGSDRPVWMDQYKPEEFLLRPSTDCTDYNSSALRKEMTLSCKIRDLQKLKNEPPLPGEGTDVENYRKRMITTMLQAYQSQQRNAMVADARVETFREKREYEAKLARDQKHLAAAQFAEFAPPPMAKPPSYDQDIRTPYGSAYRKLRPRTFDRGSTERRSMKVRRPAFDRGSTERRSVRGDRRDHSRSEHTSEESDAREYDPRDYPPLPTWDKSQGHHSPGKKRSSEEREEGKATGDPLKIKKSRYRGIGTPTPEALAVFRAAGVPCSEGASVESLIAAMASRRAKVDADRARREAEVAAVSDGGSAALEARGARISTSSAESGSQVSPAVRPEVTEPATQPPPVNMVEEVKRPPYRANDSCPYARLKLAISLHATPEFQRDVQEGKVPFEHRLEHNLRMLPAHARVEPPVGWHRIAVAVTYPLEPKDKKQKRQIFVLDVLRLNSLGEAVHIASYSDPINFASNQGLKERSYPGIPCWEIKSEDYATMVVTDKFLRAAYAHSNRTITGETIVYPSGTVTRECRGRYDRQGNQTVFVPTSSAKAILPTSRFPGSASRLQEEKSQDRTDDCVSANRPPSLYNAGASASGRSTTGPTGPQAGGPFGAKAPFAQPMGFRRGSSTKEVRQPPRMPSSWRQRHKYSEYCCQKYLSIEDPEEKNDPNLLKDSRPTTTRRKYVQLCDPKTGEEAEYKVNLKQDTQKITDMHHLFWHDKQPQGVADTTQKEFYPWNPDHGDPFKINRKLGNYFFCTPPHPELTPSMAWSKYKGQGPYHMMVTRDYERLWDILHPQDSVERVEPPSGSRTRRPSTSDRSGGRYPPTYHDH